MSQASDDDATGWADLIPSRASLLRIAIPSWRFLGVRLERQEPIENVSREEIQALFGHELSSARETLARKPATVRAARGAYRSSSD